MRNDYIAATKQVPSAAVDTALKLQVNINKGFYLVRAVAGIVLLVMGIIAFLVGLCKKPKTEEEEAEEEEAEK